MLKRKKGGPSWPPRRTTPPRRSRGIKIELFTTCFVDGSRPEFATVGVDFVA